MEDGKGVEAEKNKRARLRFLPNPARRTTEYAAGVRRIYSSILSPLAINSQGQIGPSFTSQTQSGFFQAIKAKDGPYNPGAMANAKGHGGLTFNLPSQSGFFQALKESNDGFDLANGEGSQILDTSGNVLATVTTTKGAPALTFASGQSLKTLYDAGDEFSFDGVNDSIRKAGRQEPSDIQAAITQAAS